MQRDLDALAFSVLASLHQHGATQWRDWFQTTRARRGKRGLGNGTFSETVKRLVAAGRVQIDKDGCYQVVLDGNDIANIGIYQPAVSTDMDVSKDTDDTDRCLTDANSGSILRSLTSETKAASETRPNAGVFLEAFREAEAENAKLRAENKKLLDWITGDADALLTLQSLYLNPDEPAGNRIKAAAAAIGYERPKLTASIGVVVDFRDKVRQARLKSAAKLIEHTPDPEPA